MSTSSSTSTGGSGKSAPIIREFVKVQVGGNARGQSHPIRFRLVSYYILAKELDEFDSFYKKSTEGLGYSGIYIQRSGQKRDGCGIFYNKNRAELLLEEMVEYNVLVPPIHDEASSSDKRKAPPTNRNNRGDPMQDLLGKFPGLSVKSSPRHHGDPNDPRLRFKKDCVGIMAAFKLKRPPLLIMCRRSSKHSSLLGSKIG